MPATAALSFPVTGGMAGVATRTSPLVSVRAMPATPAFSTLALTSPAEVGAVKPERSAVATRRFLR